MSVAFIDRIRKNHALEHGTIAVLLQMGAGTPLAGNATPGGFNVFGNVSTEDLTAAASEALRLFKAGHRELAVSPYCGTNLVVGALLAGVLTAIIMRNSKRRLGHLPMATTAILGSTLLGRPLGQIVQRHYTTLPDLEDAEVTRIKRLSLGRFTVHRVRVSHTAG